MSNPLINIDSINTQVYTSNNNIFIETSPSRRTLSHKENQLLEYPIVVKASR